MREWCHLSAIIVEILQQKYFQLSVPDVVYITWDNYATCKAVSFDIRVLYTQVTTVAPPTDGRVVYMISHFMTRCIS